MVLGWGKKGVRAMSPVCPVGIVCDFDGVLVRSEELSHAAACAVRRHLNLPPFTFSEYCQIHQQPLIKVLVDPLDPATVDEDEIWEIFRQIFDEPACELCLGAREFLEYLVTQDIPRALVSACGSEIVEKRLAHHGLTDTFTFMECGMDSKRAALQKACADMGVGPSGVWSIGDVRSDMRDSRAVGLVPIGVLSPFSPTVAHLIKEGAHIAFPSLRELLVCLTRPRSRTLSR